MSEPSSAVEAPLLAALSQLPTGSLFTLGDKTQLFEALALCRDGAVRAPQWARGRSVLTVEVVSGRRVHEVTLIQETGGLNASCECQLANARTCPHRLAVFFTLKKALAPASVAGWHAEAKELEAIRAALIEPTPARNRKKKERERPVSRAAAVYAVVLEERYGVPCVEVIRDGLPVHPFDRGLPAPLRPLLSGPYDYYGGRPSAALTALLDAGTFSWPVFVREGEVLAPLAVDPPVTRRGRLRLDARADGLLARRVLDDGTLLGGSLFWLDSWVADIEQRRLVRLASPGVWSLWGELLAQVAPVPGEGYRLAWPNFYGIEMLTEVGESPPLDDFLLLADGREEEPAAAPLQAYLLKVDTDTVDGTVNLMAGACAGTRSLPLDPRALALFAEGLSRQTSAALRAFKRRRVLYETFFAARTAATKTERNKIVRAALQGPDFRQRAVASEAREVLDHFFSFAREETWHLTFAEGRWQLLRRDRDREAALLAILYRHFGEPAFRNAPIPGQLQVSREAFFARLPVLLAELQAAGFELLLNDRAALPAALEITVDVDAAAGDIDWFELRPEIRCDGALLTGEMWRQALAEGVFEAGGRLWLLDEQSRRALAILADLAGPAGKKRREVVRLPRLHILDCLELRRLGARLRLAAEDERILASLARFEALPERPEPRLGAALRDYQRLGWRWLAFLYEHKFGACLADDMGLGKTIQAISLLAGLRQGLIASRCPRQTPHLVVVPPSLLFNWESEIARFAPELRTLVYRGQGRSPDFAGVDIVLTSYDIVRLDLDRLADIPFHIIIFDEAQAVKNVHAAVTGAARRLQGVFKLALTGTPVENHLGEFWSIIDLVLPGLLGEYRRLKSPRAEVDPQLIGRLIARTRPFLLRRSKEKVATELPDKIEIDLHLELTDSQKALYRQTVEEVRGEVAAAWQQRTAAQARITALAALTRLRRLCLDPRLVGGDAEASSPKIEALCEQLAELREEGHSVLVFSQFTSFLDLVEPALEAAGIPWLRLDGGTPVGERRKLVERFQGSSEPLVFLLSLKAGGRGLNLTRATYVIHLDPWWNPAVENQASDRAHRIGQTRKVTVLRLLMRHTVEEKMMLLKTRKEQLYQALLEEGRDGGGAPLTREDFEFLVGEAAG
jgi:non-specific serine/threonine protein kinase